MILKRLIILAILSILIGCSDKLDFDFYDSMDRMYKVSSLKASFKKHYGGSYKPFIVLIETPNSEDQNYKQQMLILDSLDEEELNVIFVVANQENEMKNLYHLKVDAAREIAKNKGIFRIRILNGDGVIIGGSFNVLGSEQIVKMLGK